MRKGLCISLLDPLCWCVGASRGVSRGRFRPRECFFFSLAGFGESGFCVVFFRWPGMWRWRIDVDFGFGWIRGLWLVRGLLVVCVMLIR
jgi:hypothetical protein